MVVIKHFAIFFQKKVIFFEIGAKIISLPVFNQSIYLIMPVHKTNGGYKFGESGKTYPTRQQAERQGQAIYASGYKENKKK